MYFFCLSSLFFNSRLCQNTDDNLLSMPLFRAKVMNLVYLLLSKSNESNNFEY
jgi:hypothetical protein